MRQTSFLRRSFLGNLIPRQQQQQQHFLGISSSAKSRSRLQHLNNNNIMITSSCSSSLRFTSSNSNNNNNSEDDFSFDATAAISKDAEQVSQQQKILNLVNSLLPPNGSGSTSSFPAAAYERLQVFFTKEPINECIQADRVVITHVANESGEDTKLKLPEMSFEEAMEQAQNNNRDLQQVALNRGVAYCRLRDAKANALKSIEDLIGDGAGDVASSKNDQQHQEDDSSSQSSSSTSSSSSIGKPLKKRELNVHAFRDAVDSHFCDWRGAKIVNELARGHPIKLQILQFISPRTAFSKMEEMMQSIKNHAETDKDFESGLKKEPRPIVGHQSTGIHVSDKELAVTLQPTAPGQAIKHPSPAEWKAGLKRHEQLCNKSDRKSVGTYEESKVLKPRQIGARTYRVDKYGRRLD